ncbi:MAG TPA: LexA family transcriptional regulator [Deltaproteobacteria bacterium]|nr:MAG: repressor LexA [Deltaproteobacteria bacterium GWA2_55_82]OGQ63873.1 MAG: repressor LexA [Deltaproteobacteria bacterium RIFCSPLOWO2_02_FULL_55_12]OIJ72664.1 MAG: repressor LexA [Deltaproteobacteria bacterium GWC2_55_46]HBG47570.1 LexA family transcriptional regulator [Deltaproteobacteria bacterium]HCY10481.1 LexA family transcriptional regulator [Deltaproteobacteria bacterium]
MENTLTSRQKEILDFLRGFIREAGYPPSLRDICARFGISGPKNAAKHLDALVKKGFIKRAAGASRAIELLDPWIRDGVSIPIAGRVRAGAPQQAVEDIMGHVVLDERFFKCREAFLLKVEGESMVGAGISDGDFVVVRPQPDALDGEIVVALVNNEATVKRFSRSGKKMILKPENPTMAPIEVCEGNEFSIVGKVISVIRRLER